MSATAFDFTFRPRWPYFAPVVKHFWGEGDMAQKASGRSDREGMSTREALAMFPTNEAAEKWFESVVWDEGRFCPHCGSGTG